MDLTAMELPTLQSKLLNIIVGQRLYKDYQLQQIFDEAVKQNAYTMGEETVRELCDLVLSDLE